jgi:signal transduction histidine kinase
VSFGGTRAKLNAMTFGIRPEWSGTGSSRVIALLVVLTILPAACVLWFMTAALENNAAAAQQRILSAYRGQLRLVRSRLDGLWRNEATRLATTGGNPAGEFERVITSQLAEGVVLLDEDGGVSFPSDGPFNDVAEIAARIAAAARLGPGPRATAVSDIANRLNDYSEPLPARERLRLMGALRALAPNVWLPTEAALALSLEFMASERPAAASDVVRRTVLPDVWALTASDRRAIALYRTGRIEEMLHDYLHQVSPEGVVFVAFPPEVAADAEAVAAGPWLPGWQLSFVPLDQSVFANDVRRRRTIYVSVALSGIGLMLLAGLVGGRSMQRHLRVARLKTDLVAAASHELRTPLASMRVLIDGLLADPEFDPSKTREYLALMAIENERLSRLIGNFLTFARLERNQHRFELAPVSAAEVVTAAVAAIRDRIGASRDVRVEIESDLPPILAERDSVTTALINLLENAAKYSPADQRIVVKASRDGNAFVAFSVSDNGIGIPPREQRRIFRRFYRVDNRLASATTGVGLGLSIVDLIARGHDGQVTVHSEPGAGSTFTLRVRRVPEGVAA